MEEMEPRLFFTLRTACLRGSSIFLGAFILLLSAGFRLFLLGSSRGLESLADVSFSSLRKIGVWSNLVYED
jgi:hypothetical protein